MKDQSKTEIKVGITVIVGILIFLFILSWAKNFTVNSGRKNVEIVFASVAGLEVGDPVAISGVRKGYVDEIKIMNDKVNVTIDLDGDVKLNEDARFYIMMLDLMGGKKVEIDPGRSLNEMNYSKLHQGEFLGDIASAMAVFGSVQTDLVDVIREVKTSLSHINKTFSDDKLFGDLKTSVENLSLLTSNLNKVLNANKDDINKLLKSGNELTVSVNDFIKDNKDSIRQTISTLQSTLQGSKILISKLSNFMDKTDKGENNLGKILSDKEMIDDLKTSIQNLKELSKLLLEQLKNEGIKVDANIDLF